MKNIALLFCVFFGLTAIASTNITTPTVSGHWTFAGSPYLIHNTINIPYGDSLIIDPGVEVLFQGYYSVEAFGKLKAIGDSALPIEFDVQDTTGWYVQPSISTLGGWGGIVIYTNGSEFKFANVQHLKNGSIDVRGNLVTASCNFHDNKQSGISFFSTDFSVGFEMKGWKIFNNRDSLSNLVTLTNTDGGPVNIHDCTFSDNSIVGMLMSNGPISFTNNLVFDNGSFSDGGAANILRLNGGYSIITRNRIFRNTLTKTAPIVVLKGIVDINANYICNNQTLDSGDCGVVYGGGAIFLCGSGLDTGAYSYVVRNNVIANNYCAYLGGAIYDVSGNAKIINNTIFNNKAPLGSAIYINFVPTIHIKNNIFYGNTNVGATYLSSPDIDGRCNSVAPIELLFDHNWIGHPYHQAVNFQLGSLIAYLSDTTANLVGITPGLIAPTTSASVIENALIANFGLFPTSTCINHGLNFGISGPIDYAGNNRMIGSSIDIGAYEFGSVPFLQNEIVSTSPTISVYPNPAVNVLFVSTNEPKGLISILDISGKEVANEKVSSTSTWFDIHNLPRGIYFAIWNDGTSEKLVQKVVFE